MVSEPWIAEPNQTSSPESLATSVAPSTAAEKTKYRQDAQRLLADIISLRDDLSTKAINLWAALGFEQSLLTIEKGDQQYGNGNYLQSITSYQRALDELSALSLQAVTTLDATKQASFVAIESASNESDIITASDNASLAMAIDPQDPKVQLLAQRAKRLPELIALLEDANQFAQEGDLEKAKSLYEQALTIDPVHIKTQSALTSTTQLIINNKFSNLMSAGFFALDKQQFTEARLKFNEAQALFPNELSAERALNQVDGQESQKLVDDKMFFANQFESNEEWQKALTIYDELLATDATLITAKVRRISVSVRASLNNQIEEILKAPLSLSATNVFQTGQQVLADAQNIPDAGQVLLRQIKQLETVLAASQIPVKVTVQSDGLTEVIIYRIGNLNRFKETSVLLKPGNYVAVGKRKGYRDVRSRFIVGNQSVIDPVIVICIDVI